MRIELQTGRRHEQGVHTAESREEALSLASVSADDPRKALGLEGPATATHACAALLAQSDEWPGLAPARHSCSRPERERGSHKIGGWQWESRTCLPPS
jgi:hypothetical protein